MAVDLHIHSTCSDGTLTPEQIVQVALDKKLTAIAITDHDTVAGVAAAQQAAQGSPLRVLPAIEISTTHQGRELHILGYLVDTEDAALLEELRRICAARWERACQIADKLGELGIDISYEQIATQAKGDSVGRPHVAAMLVKEGYANNAQEAFARYLGRGRPAFVERYGLTPTEAIETIAAAGGLPVLAHPGLEGAEEWIDELIQQGLQGIEVYHIAHTPARSSRYMSIARQKRLLVTGGTDSHGPDGPLPVEIGAVAVPDEYADRLLQWTQQRRQASAR